MIRREVYTHTCSKTMTAFRTTVSNLTVTGFYTPASSVLYTGVKPTITITYTRKITGGRAGVQANFALTVLVNNSSTGTGTSFGTNTGTLAEATASWTVDANYIPNAAITRLDFRLHTPTASNTATGTVVIKSIVITYATTNKTVTAGNPISTSDAAAIGVSISSGTVIKTSTLNGTVSGITGPVIKASEWNAATVTYSASKGV